MSKEYTKSGVSDDLQLGKRGPRLVNSSGLIRVRNSNNSSFINIEASDPTTPDHLATKRYVDQNSGGGVSGTGSLNFGSFPGSSDTSLTITGQTGIQASSIVEAWIMPVDTVDHSIDEHIIDPPNVTAGNIVAGVGFTIYGINNSLPLISQGNRKTDQAPRRYGIWNVAWRYK